jgi:hypothetical protein
MTIEPIRLCDIERRSGDTISRTEAARQFKFSFAVVVTFVIGMLAATAMLPLSGRDDGYGTASATMQLAED